MHHYVYKITNKLNNNYYYGVHFGELDDDYYGSGDLIGRAIAAHGKDNFEKDIVAICQSREMALEIETGVIGDLWMTRDCYNLCPGGGNPPSFKGKIHSKETKQKMRDNHKGMCGKQHSDETKRKMSAVKTGKKCGPLSNETKAKLSAAATGKKRGPRSDEAKHKTSEAMKVAWAKRKGLV